MSRVAPQADLAGYFQTRYAQHWLKVESRYHDSLYYEFVRRCLSERGPQEVLECGIGTGTPNALQLAETGIAVTGVDLSPLLLGECRHVFEARGLSARLACGDVCALPLASERFDVAYCISTSWYVPVLDELLGEMFRVARRGALVVVDIINLWHVTGFTTRLYKPVRESRWAQRLFGRSFVPIVRSWRKVGAMLRRHTQEVRFYGFEVLLPSTLPLLQERANIVASFPKLAHGLSSSPTRWLGSKILFVAQKP